MSEILTAEQVKTIRYFTKEDHRILDSHEALRARLAECEGRSVDAANEWRKVVADITRDRDKWHGRFDAHDRWIGQVIPEREAAKSRVLDLERQHAADQQRIAELTSRLETLDKTRLAV